MLKNHLTTTGIVLLAATSLFASDNPMRARGADRESAQLLQKIQNTAFGSASGKRIADSMADFGFELHKAFTSVGRDTTTSPFSLTSAFGLLANGAKSSTYDEVATGLKLKGMELSDFNQGYSDLTQSLKQIGKENVFSYGNAVFADLDFPVQDTYEARVKQFFGASGENVNFKKPQEAADKINEYVEGQTHQMIKNMVDASSVKDWRAALVNAGYYKGAWAFKFDAELTTEDADFQTATQLKKVPMMRQYGKTFLYHAGNGFQMASLAYKNGDFAMDLIVPNQSKDPVAALEAVEAQLTGSNYRQWIATSYPTAMMLGLPRFETEFKQDVTRYFKKIMPLAFSDSANFSEFSPEPVKVDAVIHATKLKVNEEGTEGAFATVIGMERATTAIRRPAPMPQVIADRPFLMIIRHTATGTPIFVSTVWDPKPLPKP